MLEPFFHSHSGHIHTHTRYVCMSSLSVSRMLSLSLPRAVAFYSNTVLRRISHSIHRRRLFGWSSSLPPPPSPHDNSPYSTNSCYTNTRSQLTHAYTHTHRHIHARSSERHRIISVIPLALCVALTTKNRSHNLCSRFNLL